MIYLTLDIQKSLSQTRKFIQEYNQRIKQEKGPEAGKFTLKATHVNTAEAIIRAYFMHMRELERTGTVVNKFFLNNVAIATMRGFQVNKQSTVRGEKRSSVTSWAHISRLQAAGFITEKINHGSNSGYEVKINTACLIATQCPAFTIALADFLGIRSDEKGITDLETYKKLNAIIPSFTAFPSGMIKFSNHIANRTLTEQNINMGKGIVNFSNKDFLKLQTAEEREITNDVLLPTANKTEQPAANMTEQKPMGKTVPQKKQKDVAPDRENSGKIALFARLAWSLAHVSLWKGRNLAADQVELARQWIEFYFSRTESERTLSQLYNEFTERIELARRFLARSPERFMPPAGTYFDPHFKHGFYGTEKWLHESRRQRKINKDFNSNARLLGLCWRKFAADPSWENYRVCTQIIGKKRDERLKIIWAELVVYGQQQCPEIFGKYIQERIINAA